MLYLPKNFQAPCGFQILKSVPTFTLKCIRDVSCRAECKCTTKMKRCADLILCRKSHVKERWLLGYCSNAAWISSIAAALLNEQCLTIAIF